jgi:hypothetical protein
MSCSTSRVFPKSTSMQINCGGREIHGFSLAFRATERTLLIEKWDTGIHVDENRHRIGFRLPCGASLRLQPLEFRDPKWKPKFGSRCADRCRRRDKSCQDACYRKWADDFGMLAPRGNACIDRCFARDTSCISHCSSIGEFP